MSSVSTPLGAAQTHLFSKERELMAKPKECSKCGCNRQLLIKAKIEIGTTTYDLKRLCMPCLIKVADLSVPEDKKAYNYKKAMACIGEERA